MTESVNHNVERRIPPIPHDHSRHDRLLVTRYAADDAYPGESEEARELVASCGECAALAADIRSLMTATAALPPARRRRDFRLSHEQAGRLRGTFVERLVRRLAAPEPSSVRPLAGVAVSIGLVLAVIGAGLPLPAPAALPASPGMGEVEGFGNQPLQRDSSAVDDPDEGEAPEAEATFGTRTQSAAGTPAAAPQEAAPGAEPGEGAAGQPEPGAEPGDGVIDEPREPGSEPAPEEPAEPEGESGALYASAEPDPVRMLLVYGGLGLALASLAVLLLSWLATRSARDPLLR